MQNVVQFVLGLEFTFLRQRDFGKKEVFYLWFKVIWFIFIVPVIVQCKLMACYRCV